ncbi:uncharacterized protein LOC127875866 [Dreissena polymorpha]|uniref:uncharacterized protein LOC127875866 n=1 Tax=Dreissena polymorpha TaxID=45954 RepID=UPI0022647DF7|nr:uncharacterized protein LOC127875866 [Dreissena polymorpha]
MLQTQNSYLHGEIGRLWNWYNVLDGRLTETQQLLQQQQLLTQLLTQQQLLLQQQQPPQQQQLQQQQPPQQQQLQQQQPPQQQQIQQQQPDLPSPDAHNRTYGGYTKAQLLSDVSGITDASNWLLKSCFAASTRRKD